MRYIFLCLMLGTMCKSNKHHRYEYRDYKKSEIKQTQKNTYANNIIIIVIIAGCYIGFDFLINKYTTPEVKFEIDVYTPAISDGRMLASDCLYKVTFESIFLKQTMYRSDDHILTYDQMLATMNYENIITILKSSKHKKLAKYSFEDMMKKFINKLRSDMHFQAKIRNQLNPYVIDGQTHYILKDFLSVCEELYS